MVSRARVKQALPVSFLRRYHAARRRRDRVVAGVVPVTALRAFRGARGKWDRNDPLFDSDAHAGPLARTYAEISALPGYFTYDDAVAFTLILATQSAAGIRGDVLEIGSYHGRSTIFMARCVEAQERLIVCDTFEESVEDIYPEPPSPSVLRRNLGRWAPNLEAQQLDIREGRSETLDLGAAKLRFAHIDGGHPHEVALHDLQLVADHMAAGGVVAVDDYEHPRWPGVTSAVHEFLRQRPDMRVLADVNRWTESGRKLYLRAPLAGS